MEQKQPEIENALRKSFAVIKELKRQLAEAPNHSGPARPKPIAVVGMACRFPGGADTPEKFWQILAEGRDTLSEIPADRWDWRQYYNPDPDVPGTHYVRHGSFIDRVGDFEPEFFGISGREADSLDPQQRLLLETSWEAIERAGTSPATLRHSRTGVFLGIGQNDYAQLQMYGGKPERINAYDGTGISFCFAAARLSYVLGLQGPNLAVDTACSSALVALHLACQSLANGECEQALAGGSHLVVSPEVTIYLSRLRALSPDGRSKAFSADADGYGRGEGCGMLLLKRLSDAERDGDKILAVIRGSAVNHGGASSGLTVPNGLAQQALLREALERSGLQPHDIDAIETHGTGTSLGDPIEASALGEIFPKAGRQGPLYLSSVKTNIGHLEAAAGIAGVIRTILTFEHRALPPHLYLREKNPHIDWERTPFALPLELTPWSGRRAGVSAFGLGGTNAHVILEAPPAEAPAQPTDGAWPLLLSARSPAALAALRDRYVEILGQTDAPFADIARTVALGRQHFEHRLAVVASTSAEALSQLNACPLTRAAAHPSPPGGRGAGGEGASPNGRHVAFLFTGQGSQYCGMGAALMRYPGFRQAVEQCAGLVEKEAGWSPLPFIADETDNPRIDQTEVTQPALFTLQVGLVALWKALGVTPTAVLGHSIGEFAAAWAAGVLNLEDAARLVVRRGRLMQQLPAGGGMAALRASAAQAEAALRDFPELCLAAINGPRAVTIAGALPALDACLAQLEAQGVSDQRLPVSHAFHSALMAPMLDDFAQVAAGVKFSPPTARFVATGADLPTADVARPAYWRDQIRNPVRFAAAVEALALTLGDGDALIEIGPSAALIALARQSADPADALWLPSLDPRQPQAFQNSLAALYAAGRDLDWQAVFPGPRRAAVLPTYPFQRRRCWIAADPGKEAVAARPSRNAHPLLGEAIASPLAEKQYATVVSPTLPAFLADHRVLGEVVFPAAGFVEAALAAAAAHLGSDRLRLSAIEFQRPLTLAGDTRLHLTLTPGDRQCAIAIHSPRDDGWQLHMTCTAAPLPAGAEPGTLPAVTGDPVASADGDDFYAASRQRGIDYGPSFQTLRRLDTVATDQGAADYSIDPALAEPRFRLHPLLLDTALQALAAARPDIGKQTFIPAAIEQLDFTPGTPLQGRARTAIESQPGAGTVLCAFSLVDADGTGRVAARGIRMQKIAALAGQQAPTWLPVWEAIKAPEPQRLAGHWLLIGADALLPPLLEAQGAQVTVIRDITEAIRALPILGRLAGVCRLALDPDPAAPAATELALVQALTHLSEAEQPRLVLVTRGAQAVEATGEQPDIAAGALWGLARVVRNEFPALNPVCVDLDPVSSDDDCARAIAFECAASDEDQVAWRHDARFALRLMKAATRPPTDRPTPGRLACRSIGDLDSLAYLPLDLPPPAAGEVRVRVRAAGINFKDVLHALGVLDLPADSAFGFDAAGVVEAVGPGADFVVGDRVMLTLTPGTLGDMVNARSDFVCRIPGGLDFATAAGLPLAYLTAWHALVTVAGLKAGDKVLIHAGAGGVGQAAIQIARHLGAEVHTTASAPKQRYLRTLGLAGIYSSRNADFRNEVQARTGGVDVVLNSLSGELIAASFDCLSPAGRFVEIGKAGIWSDAQAAAFRPDVAYTAFDLADVARADPGAIRRLFAAVAAGLEAGALAPLPIHAFAPEAVANAFRLISRARQIGKAVVVFPAAADPAPGVHLITGGFGSLARLLVQDLIDRGERRIALLVRPGTSTDLPADYVPNPADAQIRVYAADLADVDALHACLATIARDFSAPVRSVYHLAGVLADGALVNQTADTFAQVAAPKLHGACNLHRATRGLDLDRFVVFSSAAALVGTPGQSSYAVANAGLDALAAARHGAGLPALSVNWGPWGGEGMAARLADVDRQRMASAGLTPLDPAPAWEAMHRLLAEARPQALVMNVNWSRFAEQLPGARTASLFRHLAAAPAAEKAATAGTAGLLEQIAALPAADRRAELFRALQQRIAAILGRPNPDDIAPGHGFFAMGMDSLTSMELRNRLQRELSCKLPATLAFDYGSVEALADHLLATVPPWQAVAVPASAVTSNEADRLAKLSESDLAAMLAKELGQ